MENKNSQIGWRNIVQIIAFKCLFRFLLWNYDVLKSWSHTFGTFLKRKEKSTENMEKSALISVLWPAYILSLICGF